ncbi:MAG: hypothetical protein AAB403_19755 [Planctomycetota bacterium]
MNRVRLEELEKALDRRKAELGFSGGQYVLANAGANRTAEKRELLEAIREAASRAGKTPAFIPETAGMPKAKT